MVNFRKGCFLMLTDCADLSSSAEFFIRHSSGSPLSRQQVDECELYCDSSVQSQAFQKITVGGVKRPRESIGGLMQRRWGHELFANS
jgi:hypothetical protein